MPRMPLVIFSNETIEPLTHTMNSIMRSLISVPVREHACNLIQASVSMSITLGIRTKMYEDEEYTYNLLVVSVSISII